jgi:hypothetical protein
VTEWVTGVVGVVLEMGRLCSTSSSSAQLNCRTYFRDPLVKAFECHEFKENVLRSGEGGVVWGFTKENDGEICSQEHQTCFSVILAREL